MIYLNMPQQFMVNHPAAQLYGAGMVPATADVAGNCGTLGVAWGQPIVPGAAGAAGAAGALQQQKKKKKRKPIELGKKHRAVVTRIGEEPLLKIEDLGEFRFAYRSVKRFPKGSSRPYVMVGDQVECRLCVGPNPPVAYSIKIIHKADDEPPALLEGDDDIDVPESESDERSTSTSE